MQQSTPLFIVLTAADTARQLAARGIEVQVVRLGFVGFDLYGLETETERKFTLEVCFETVGTHVRATIVRRLGQCVRTGNATASDRTAAVLAALN